MIELQVETIAACNARCVFCTYPTMRRARGRMDDETFAKVVTDAKELEPFIERIYVQGLGEPLMDKDIGSRIFALHRALPAATIGLFTNGSRLDSKMIATLVGAGVGELVISLTGVNAEQRQAAMGLDDYDHVVRWADHARRMLPTQVKLILSRDLIEDPAADVGAFQRRWGSSALVTYEGNWAGEQWKFRGLPHVKPCRRALEQLMVLWSGDVALCCFDGEGELTFGNVRDRSLREIWASEERQRVVRLHKEGRRQEIGLCKNCTGI